MSRPRSAPLRAIRPPTARRARGRCVLAFTLIEAVIVVLVLAIAIPPSVAMLTDAADDRADAVNISRGTTLATAILESVSADAASDAPGLGAAAFDDMPAYLDDPAAGLRARLVPVTEPYAGMGFGWTLAAEPLSGLTPGEIDRIGGDVVIDELRLVTVTVSAPAARGGTLDITASVIVGDLSP